MTDSRVREQTKGVEEAVSASSNPKATHEDARLRAIYDDGFSYMVHSLRRLGVHERDLEDVAHDAFIAVYRHFHEYDASRPVRPWLFGIAFRSAAGYRRRARYRHEVNQEAMHIADSTPGADTQLIEEQRRRLVIEALDTIDLPKRAVFVMHDLDGSAVPEIATTLGIPLNTAYSRLRAARSEFETVVDRLRKQRGLT